MSDRIKRTFEKKGKKLVTFTTGGDPDLETSFNILKIIINNKIDIVEIGMPFSDPMADGPTIQESSTRSIENGTIISDIFELVKKIRYLNNEIPVILMGYYNSIFNMGIKKFTSKCVEVGCNQVQGQDPYHDVVHRVEKEQKHDASKLCATRTAHQRRQRLCN